MNGSTLKGADAKAMLQDLKGNRRVQGALVLLALMLWYVWPASKPAVRLAGAKGAPSALGDLKARELGRLPQLSRLDKAGELPTEARLLRDLFQFEGEPPPPKPVKPPPPPPPPAAEELEARRLAQERAQEGASRPSNLRYLGYLATGKAGRLGAFMKGEEGLTCRQGELVNPRWRLTKVTDLSAEFRNVKFTDLQFRLDSVEPKASATTTPANEF